MNIILPPTRFTSPNLICLSHPHRQCSHHPHGLKPPSPSHSEGNSLPKVTLKPGTLAGPRLESSVSHFKHLSEGGLNPIRGWGFKSKALGLSKRLANSGARRPSFGEVRFTRGGLLVAPRSQPRTTQGSGPRFFLCSWHTSQAAQVGSRTGPSPGCNSNHPQLARPPGLLPDREHSP